MLKGDFRFWIQKILKIKLHYFANDVSFLYEWIGLHPIKPAHDFLRARDSRKQYFLRLFQTYPDLQNLFRGLEKMPAAELRQSKRMAAHGATFMSAISNFVDNLEDSETLLELLDSTARNHKTRGIEKNTFKVRHV